MQIRAFRSAHQFRFPSQARSKKFIQIFLTPLQSYFAKHFSIESKAENTSRANDMYNELHLFYKKKLLNSLSNNSARKTFCVGNKLTKKDCIILFIFFYVKI